MRRLADLVVRWPWAVIGVWIAMAIALPLTFPSLGEMAQKHPLAILPMLVDGQTVGVIAIVGLLEQKHAWVQVDQELFHLLGSHAAAALISAHLYQKEPDLLSAIAGLGDSLK